MPPFARRRRLPRHRRIARAPGAGARLSRRGGRERLRPAHRRWRRAVARGRPRSARRRRRQGGRQLGGGGAAGVAHRARRALRQPVRRAVGRCAFGDRRARAPAGRSSSRGTAGNRPGCPGLDQGRVARGAGELLLTSIDRDGTGEGFDCELLAAAAARVNVPIIASGGTGEASDFRRGARRPRRRAAVLAAGLFHRQELAVPDLKRYLAAQGLR